MDKNYYTTSEFMKLAHVTKKTLRYYDERGILKPAKVTSRGERHYNNEDLAHMQQILLLKYLGFSLADIRELTINSSDYRFMETSLAMQLQLVEDRIEQLQVVKKTIKDTLLSINKNKEINYSSMLKLMESIGMEQSLKLQYQNASNISTRIQLHSLYSKNTQGWFPFVFEQCNFKENTSVLELGCGDGAFWEINKKKIPKNLSVTLSDLSDGMLRDARRNLSDFPGNISFQDFACEHIPFPNQSFDCILANHVLFYCKDINKACQEISRVLKPNGTFLCSTYGKNHMKEISELANAFDDRIVLSAENLYEKFGKENGHNLLSPYFSAILWKDYQDELIIPDENPLISYILSCHGNQANYILDRFKEFRAFVKKKVNKNFHVTKEAGIFICKK